MKIKDNGMAEFTEPEWQALFQLYNECHDAFMALPAVYREAFWVGLYFPALRKKTG